MNGDRPDAHAIAAAQAINKGAAAASNTAAVSRSPASTACHVKSRAAGTSRRMGADAKAGTYSDGSRRNMDAV